MSEIRESRQEPIPGYRLVERLGRGGYGEVWKVEAPGGFLKAMKFVFGNLTADDDDANSAGQELRSLNRILHIRHPFIISIERFDIVDGQLLIVMELADRNLEDRLRECRRQGLQGIPREELMRYMAEAAEALDMMSAEYDLQHLDIKPANLFLVRKHLKVADFGLVKDLQGQETNISGGLTPLYAPPESYLGKASRASDQYSLAIVFQEMLTGKRPLDGENVAQLMNEHLHGVPNLIPLPPADRPIVAKALAKDPAERFPTCTDFVTALLEAGGTRPASTSGLTLDPPDAPSGDDPAYKDTPKRSIALPQGPEIRPASQQRLTLGGTVDWKDIAAEGQSLVSTPRPAADRRTPARSPTSMRHPQRSLEEMSVSLSLRREQRDRSMRVSGGTMVALRAGAQAIPPRLLVELDPKGTLAPIYLIGVGRTGIRMMERLARKLNRRFGAAAEWLPIRFLGIDSDADVIQDLDRNERVSPVVKSHFLSCKLRRASDYRNQWDSLKHLSSWLDSEQLLKIGPSGDAKGLRGLGRLALLDNYGRVAGRMIADLEQLASPTTAAAAQAATGFRFRSDQMRIVVAAGMGGGTGSGMTLDLAYLSTAILKAAGVQDPDVQLLLMAGLSPATSQDQQKINHYALAQDLLQHCEPDSTFTLPLELPGLPYVMDGAPIRRALFFDCESENMPQPKDEVVLDAMAEYVGHAGTSAFGKDLDAALAGEAKFYSLGWFSLASPTDPVLRAAACELCSDVVGRWLSPLSAEETDDTSRHAREQIDDDAVSPARFSELLQKSLAAVDPKPPHQIAAEAINEFLDRLEAESDRTQFAVIARGARSELRKLMGPDPVDDDEVYESGLEIQQLYRKATELASDELFVPLRASLNAIADADPLRWEAVRVAWLALSDLASKLFERYSELPKTKEIERVFYEAAYQIHRRIVLGGNRTQFVRDLENYAREKNVALFRKHVGETYLLISSRLQALSGEMSAVPRRFDGAREWLLHERERTADLGTGANQQLLFQDGSLMLEDAVAEVKRRRGPHVLDLLEQRLRVKVVTPRGGFWATGTAPELSPEELGEQLAFAAAAWLQEFQLPNDTAGAFLDRHAASPETLDEELKTFFDWAQPSLVGRQPKPGTDEEPAIHRFLVATPESKRGIDLLKAILKLELPEHVEANPRGGDQVLFVRLAGHRSLGRLVPLWLLKGRPLYDAACLSKTTPHIFAEV